MGYVIPVYLSVVHGGVHRASDAGARAPFDVAVGVLVRAVLVDVQECGP